jgi:hypothetical protein
MVVRSPRQGPVLSDEELTSSWGAPVSDQTEYCSLYAQEKINYFFKDITRCLPNLRHIDLQCGYPYGTLKYGPVRFWIPSYAGKRE